MCQSRPMPATTEAWLNYIINNDTVLRVRCQLCKINQKIKILSAARNLFPCMYLLEKGIFKTPQSVHAREHAVCVHVTLQYQEYNSFL